MLATLPQAITTGEKPSPSASSNAATTSSAPGPPAALRRLHRELGALAEVRLSQRRERLVAGLLQHVADDGVIRVVVEAHDLLGECRGIVNSGGRWPARRCGSPDAIARTVHSAVGRDEDSARATGGAQQRGHRGRQFLDEPADQCPLGDSPAIYASLASCMVGASTLTAGEPLPNHQASRELRALLHPDLQGVPQEVPQRDHLTWSED